MSKPEVIVNGFDRITWLNEKSMNTLRHLSNLYDLLEGSKISKEEMEEILYELDFAMEDFLKVFLCLQGYPNGIKEGEFVDSSEKYLQLLENYNLNFGKMSLRNKNKSDYESYTKIFSLLNVNERENRSEINILMDKIYVKHYNYERINELLDECNLGQITWGDFCSQSKDIIKRILESM